MPHPTTYPADFNPSEPYCPECGNEMWDNRPDNAKKNDGKRRPDFRCKEDREHVIWPPSPPKGGKKGSASSAKRGYSSGDLPGDPGDEQPSARRDETRAAEPLSPEALAAADKARRDRICGHMGTAVTYVTDPDHGMLARMKRNGVVMTETGLAAMVNSLFIGLCDSRNR